MKITALNFNNNIPNINTNRAHSTSFKQKEYAYSLDSYTMDNISHMGEDSLGEPNRIIFKKPVTVTEALDSILNTPKAAIKKRLLSKLHTEEALYAMKVDLERIKGLKDIKIKQLYGMGVYALAFETTDGKILKISGKSHFPGNRKPASFDLPILKSGKSGYTYYYLEEKVSQGDLTQEELRKFVKGIKAKGYTMKDYLIHINLDGSDDVIKEEQFGRAKDGKIYLIDPDCAIEPPKHFFNPKTIKEKIKNFFE